MMSIIDTFTDKRSQKSSAYRNRKGKLDGGSAVAGVVVGISLCAAFWAGHHFWPGQQVPTQATGLPAANQPLAGQVAVPPAALAFGPKTIANIATQANKSVVNIDTASTYTVSESPMMHPFDMFGNQFGFGFPDQQQVPRQFQRRGAGTGVIIRSNGFILTNNHVVGDATDIKVTLADKRSFKGKVVGKDNFTDLALVKIDATDLPVAKLGTSKDIEAGDWAIAIGSPMGLDHTVTLGIVSALGRSLYDLKNNVELIQTDAAINPGNSGGPLLNISGEVIGINTAIRGDAQNIGFAIPVDIARDVADQLLESGKIARPYLGIYMQELETQLAKSLGLPANTKGVVLRKIGPGSPADKAGLQPGDVIQKVDGKTVATSKEVQDLVRKHKVGDTINMLVLREGQLSAVDVKIGDYPTQDRLDRN